MNLKSRPRTVLDNNKILISEGFSLGKNDEVNAGLVKSKEKTTKENSTTIHKEKIALILFMTGSFAMWFMFR